LPPVPTAPPALAPTTNEVPVWPDGVLTLSASQLATYDDCPRKYAYAYALRLRGEAGVWADFGSLVHDVLEHFLDPTDPASADRSFERLMRVAEACWSDDIAPYRPQRDEARRDLFALLELWWTNEGHDPDLDVVAVEHQFTIEVGPHKLTGKIDRVSRTPSGGLAIVDYKTGKRKLAAADVADDLQLAVYHLAAQRDEELAAAGPVASLELLYLREFARIGQPITTDHAARTERRVLDAAQAILTEDAAPSVAGDCDHCDFHRLCPLQPHGREVHA
jgi:RecB family exonuclease